jgi:hypothetical protein
VKHIKKKPHFTQRGDILNLSSLRQPILAELWWEFRMIVAPHVNYYFDFIFDILQIAPWCMYWERLICIFRKVYLFSCTLCGSAVNIFLKLPLLMHGYIAFHQYPPIRQCNHIYYSVVIVEHNSIWSSEFLGGGFEREISWRSQNLIWKQIFQSCLVVVGVL